MRKSILQFNNLILFILLMFSFLLLQCNKENIEEEKQVRVSAIVVSSEKDAKELISRLDNKEDFSKLARKYSIGPNSFSGGDLGFIVYDDMGTELRDAILNTNIGEYSDYIFYNNQYYILKKIDERYEKKKIEKRTVMPQPNPLLSFLPFLLIATFFGIINFIIAPRKGKNRIVYLLLSFIPMLGIILSVYLLSLTDVSLLSKIERIENMLEELNNKSS